MNERVLAEELRNRLEEIESSDGTAHLAGDLDMRDVLLTVVGLVLAIIVLTWWAY